MANELDGHDNTFFMHNRSTAEIISSCTNTRCGIVLCFSFL